MSVFPGFENGCFERTVPGSEDERLKMAELDSENGRPGLAVQTDFSEQPGCGFVFLSDSGYSGDEQSAAVSPACFGNVLLFPAGSAYGCCHGLYLFAVPGCALLPGRQILFLHLHFS